MSPWKESKAKMGAVIGLFTSATAGFLLIDFTDTKTTPGFGFGPGTKTVPREKGFAQFLLLCSAGTLVGAIIGAKNKDERWKQVALPVRLGALPQRHGLALSFSF